MLPVVRFTKLPPVMSVEELSVFLFSMRVCVVPVSYFAVIWVFSLSVSVSWRPVSVFSHL